MQPAAFEVLGSDDVVDGAGIPVIVYGINILSSEGGGGLAVLGDGEDSGASAIISIHGSEASIDEYFHLGDRGIFFPNGCYVDIDDNVSSCTVVYRRYDGYTG